MNNKQLNRMKNDNGFIAALDQSGGSTPKALRLYGIENDQYTNDEEMFDLIHKMRERIIKSKAFNSDRILAAILFKRTMNSKIDDMYTADYLWEKKGIIPILKVDQGLLEENNGVMLMKPMTELDDLLEDAKQKNIFGTKMRSVIKEYNEEGIREIVKQQFEYALKIYEKGFVPIIEPEVDIHSKEKDKIEKRLKKEIMEYLDGLNKDVNLMFKLTIPTEAGLYEELTTYQQVVRVVALSGGYTREDANRLLSENHKMIASFSRALTEGLNVNQSEDEFDKMLNESIEGIYQASKA